MRAPRRFLSVLLMATASLLAACGGGDAADEAAAQVEADRAEALGAARHGAPLDICNAQNVSTILAAVPRAEPPAPSGPVKLHYQRADGNYADFGLHVWQVNAANAYIADYPGVSWTAPLPPAGSDAYGIYWLIDPALFRADASGFGFIVHKPAAEGDPPGLDRLWRFADGGELWLKSGEATVYRTNPDALASLDLTTLRVHYQRPDGNFTPWGLHLWDISRIDAARLPGLTLNVWENPVRFAAMPNHAAVSANEVVFDLPVLNPRDDASRSAVEFIIHGTPDNPNGGSGNKDGWTDNIRIDYANVSAVNGVAHIWLVQDTPTVFYREPDLRQASTTDARAYWLTDRLIQWPKAGASGVFKLYHSARGQIVATTDAAVSGADGAIDLQVFSGSVPADVATRFKFIAPGAVLSVSRRDAERLARVLIASQLVLVQENAAGLVQNATTAQLPGALDTMYADAAQERHLGVRVEGSSTHFKLWGPTAQRVQLCVYDSGDGAARFVEPMRFQRDSGTWSVHKPRLDGKYYRYAVEVFVRGTGLVRNLVTDPYSISLTTDSKRSYIADLDDRRLKPAGWDRHAAPRIPAQTDMSIYELHVRDFSIGDASVPLTDRGKYRAFAWANSNGMIHLRSLARAGLTDVHLLPVFDIASVPEAGCVTPAIPVAAADSEAQQAAIAPLRDADCFNWGYDPYHYTAPEGSYASDAADGAKRIVEFRQMVMALHQAGLRVGMDVVYNHTSASGQSDKSVLDRVVPGYYHRLDASGGIERSTCCENTATENLMMGKLMTDSVATWATQYRIDSFRFDLMAHQPRGVMEELKKVVDKAAGRPVQLIGEGWNFGEVANGARFVQASQLSLNGSGIATFSDRARDHVRGGGPFDGGDSLVKNQGYINGLFYEDNGSGAGKTKNDLMWSADLIKVGLAGSIRDYRLTTHWDASLKLEELDYNGQPAGYVTSPAEVVNYVENHDNQTLFDINAYKLPTATSKEDRARVQMLGAAINAFSQGIAYYHAGIDTLRSKSMDRNSYNSGDWFNRLDWTYQDNFFATGAPPQADNGDNWPVIKPLLANPQIKPTGTEIGWMRDAFRDLLAIRASSTLFRLRTADDVKARLSFRNTGSAQMPTVLAGHLDGNGYPGANFRELLYFVNVDKQPQALTLDADKGKAWVLHPVHAGGADRRAANDASHDPATGRFVVPPRTAVVYVLN
jgi:pullulanase